MRNTPDSLTARQRMFVANFLVTGNGTQAAVASGYSQVSARVGAHRLLTKPAVRAAIAAAQALDSQRLQIERQEATNGLLQAIELAKANGNPAAMVRGWREIGRMLGFYEPDRAEVVVGVVDESRLMAGMTGMSDAELAAVVAGQG